MYYGAWTSLLNTGVSRLQGKLWNLNLEPCNHSFTQQQIFSWAPACTWHCCSAWRCSGEPKPIEYLLSWSSGGCDGKKAGTFLSPAVDSADSHGTQRGAHSLLEVPRDSDRILIFPPDWDGLFDLPPLPWSFVSQYILEATHLWFLCGFLEVEFYGCASVLIILTEVYIGLSGEVSQVLLHGLLVKIPMVTFPDDLTFHKWLNLSNSVVPPSVTVRIKHINTQEYLE